MMIVRTGRAYGRDDPSIVLRLLRDPGFAARARLCAMNPVLAIDVNGSV